MVIPASSDYALVPQVERIRSYRGLATVVNAPHRATPLWQPPDRSRPAGRRRFSRADRLRPRRDRLRKEASKRKNYRWYAWNDRIAMPG